MRIRKEKEADYYNKVYAKGGHKQIYFKSAEDIESYYPTWKYAYEYIIKNNIKNVVDIGCGPGHFATLFNEEDGIKYIGIDFSHIAISQAMGKVKNKNINFLCEDLRGLELINSNFYTCFEVLEHIEGDVDVIKNIGVGKSLLFSVPNYDSTSHVRFFRNYKLIEERYGNLLEINLVHEIETPYEGKIYLCYGKRK